MEKSGVIKPDHFTGVWMACHRRTYLSGAQSVPVFPLILDAPTLAVLLHRCWICGLKYRLPVKAKAVTEVPDIHPLLLNKAIPDSGIDPRKDLPRISEWSFTALLRRQQTTEI